MHLSEARLAANRRNAARSTGPKTEEGKQRSRANALKHGLCASTVADDAEAPRARARAVELARAFEPADGFRAWLVAESALATLRIERAQQMERVARDRLALRAELTWDGDRKLEAARLGGKLADRPEEVVEALRRTPQGCDWLLCRWAMLAHAAGLNGDWTADQARLAFDLLATPAEFREGVRPGTAIDHRGRPDSSDPDPVAVARAQVAELLDRRETVGAIDEADRSLAAAGLADDTDPEIRRLRRYEATLHNRLRWCLAQLQTSAQGPEPTPEPEPGPTPESAPSPRASAPAEADAPASPPVVATARRDEKLRKADSRREARRRKLEHRRA